MTDGQSGSGRVLRLRNLAMIENIGSEKVGRRSRTEMQEVVIQHLDDQIAGRASKLRALHLCVSCLVLKQ